MHPNAVTPRRDNAGDMGAMPMRVGDAGAGIVAGMRQRRRQIRMGGINTGIGDRHKAAETGPATGIGIAETGDSQWRRCPTTMIFTRFIEG